MQGSAIVVTAAAGSQGDGATSVEGKKEGVDTLAGDQVLQLTRFIDKKSWIDSKILLLASLPPIIVLEPLPPLRLGTTQNEVEEWWKELEEIEKDVEEFDVGDLARLKKFAKNASKHSLSLRDTDLIEITLTTLFSIDKLLHLLRNRRKSLHLVDYRLQWEGQVAQTWFVHQKFLIDLTRFVEKARWAVPPDPTSPTRSQDSPIIPTETTPSTPDSPAPLILIPIPTSPTTNSKMSRTLHSELLSLSLASQSSTLHRISTLLLPQTNTSLDNLIDTSPLPLPDSFLDEQDRLEEGLRGIDQVGEFARGLLRQWRCVEEIYWSLREVEARSEKLERDVREAGVGNLPEVVLAGRFVEREERIEIELREILEKLKESGGVVLLPKCLIVPDQEEWNVRLIASIEKMVRETKEVISQGKAGVQEYSKAVQVSQHSREVQSEMERTIQDLQASTNVLRTNIADRPNLDIPSTLINSAQWEAHHQSQCTTLRTSLELVQPLLLTSSSLIVDLTKVGIDPTVRSALKERMTRLQSVSQSTNEIVREEEEMREKVRVGREMCEGMEGGFKRVQEGREKLFKEYERVKWREGSNETSEVGEGARFNLDHLQLYLDKISGEPFKLAQRIFEKAHPLLHTFLQDRATSLRDGSKELTLLQQLVEETRNQNKATREILKEVEELAGEVGSLRRKLEQESSEMNLVALLAGKEALDDTFRTLVESVHLRIPFLEQSIDCTSLSSLSTSITSDQLIPSFPSDTSSSPTSFPSSLDIGAQDRQIREKVNEATAKIGGKLNEIKEGIEYLEKVKLWDIECARLEMLVRECENEVKKLSESLLSGKGSLDRHAIRDAAHLVSVGLNEIGKNVDSHSASLDSIKITVPAALPSLTHVDRTTTLEQLISRHGSSVVSSNKLLEDIKRQEETDALALALEREAEEAKKIAEEERIRELAQKQREKELGEWEGLQRGMCERLEILGDEAVALKKTLERISTRLSEVTAIESSDDYDCDSLFESSRAALLECSNSLHRQEEELRSILNQIQLSPHSAGTSLLDIIQLSSSIVSDNKAAFERAEACLKEALELHTVRRIRSEVARLGILDKALSDFQALLDSTEVLISSLATTSFDVEVSAAQIEGLQSRRLDLLANSTLESAAEELKLVEETLSRLSNGAVSEESEEAPLRSSIPTAIESGKARLGDLEKRSSLLAQKLLQEEERLRASIILQKEGESKQGGLRDPKSSHDSVDVFGPTLYTIPSSISEEPSSLRLLEDELNAILVDQWINEKTVQLPTSDLAQRLRRQLSILKKKLSLLKLESHEEQLEYDQIEAELRRKLLCADRILALGKFSEKVASADLALSDLLTSIDKASGSPADGIDPYDGNSKSAVVPLADALIGASQSVTTVHKEAIPLLDDSRVGLNVDRLEVTLEELSGLMDDLIPLSPSIGSSTTSFPSSSGSRTSSPTPHSSSRIPQRDLSSFSKLPRSHAQQYPIRNRALSLSSTRIPIASPSSSSRLMNSSTMPQTQPSQSNTGQEVNVTPIKKRFGISGIPIISTPTFATPGGRRQSSTTTTVPRAFNLSSSNSKVPLRKSSNGAFTPIPGPATPLEKAYQRRVSELPGTLSFARSIDSASRRRTSELIPSSKRVYKVNPKRKVDVELGKIVNEFPVSVPIKAAENNSKDDSGMYWIGDIDPRLYFCRVLRSRIVFVRIGGGYEELSIFLIKHFGSSVSISPTVSMSSLSPDTFRHSTHSLNASTSSLTLTRSRSAGASPRPSMLTDFPVDGTTTPHSVSNYVSKIPTWRP